MMKLKKLSKAFLGVAASLFITSHPLTERELNKPPEEAFVVFYPDAHNDPEFFSFFVKSLEVEREMGADAVALECPYTSQPKLDAAKRTGDYSNITSDDGWFLYFRDFVQYLHGMGFDVYCIDEAFSRKEAMKRKDEYQRLFYMRDYRMAKRIEELLKQGKYVVVFIGAAHTDDIPLSDIDFSRYRLGILKMTPLFYILKERFGEEVVSYNLPLLPAEEEK